MYEIIFLVVSVHTNTNSNLRAGKLSNSIYAMLMFLKTVREVSIIKRNKR